MEGVTKIPDRYKDQFNKKKAEDKKKNKKTKKAAD